MRAAAWSTPDSAAAVFPSLICQMYMSLDGEGALGWQGLDRPPATRAAQASWACAVDPPHVTAAAGHHAANMMSSLTMWRTLLFIVSCGSNLGVRSNYWSFRSTLAAPVEPSVDWRQATRPQFSSSKSLAMRSPNSCTYRSPGSLACACVDMHRGTCRCMAGIDRNWFAHRCQEKKRKT